MKLEGNWIKEVIDPEIETISLWICNCIFRTATQSPHRQYTLEEFKNGVINTSYMDNEPLIEYQKRNNYWQIEGIKFKY